MPLWLKAARLIGAYAALVAASVVLVGVWRSVPGGDNPFIALALHHPMGAFTREKLIDIQEVPELCQETLARSALEYRAIPDRREGGFCAFEGAVRIDASQVAYSSPIQASCPLAAALYVWEREVLQPLAREHLGAEVVRVQHLGTYACRRVYGGRRGEPSQHARANAIDIMGFNLSDDRAVTVEAHWGEDGPRGRFLRALHGRSCDLFAGVLGPAYNHHHHDHLHIDMGPYDLCR
ncbi:MAG: extensin family protein [Caulobacterales bacterium]|nr:extensin family protein [Caulobacterales bacterium]